MKYADKLEYLQTNHLMVFVKTRQEVFDELSEQQTMFCCCGKLATGIHEAHCQKFQRKVNTETIKRLSCLLPKKARNENQ